MKSFGPSLNQDQSQDLPKKNIIKRGSLINMTTKGKGFNKSEALDHVCSKKEGSKPLQHIRSG